MRALACLISLSFFLVSCEGIGPFARHDTKELTPFWSDSTPWRIVGGLRLNGSWDQLGYRYTQVRVLEKFKGALYAGLASPESMRAEVWKYDGARWELVGGDGRDGSWMVGTAMAIDSLAADDNYLYAGSGFHLGRAFVWRYDGHTWERIGGYGLNGSWSSDIDDVWNMTIHKGQLYVGLQEEDSGERRAPLYRWDGTAWELMTGLNRERGGWDGSQGHHMCYVNISDGTYLYTGLSGRIGGNADVWRFDGTTFEQIGGDGIRGSWNNPDLMFVEDLIIHNGDLYASLQGSSRLGKRENPIWHFDGTTWNQVGNVPEEWENDSIFNRMISYRGQLYATAGGPKGSASMWVLSQDQKWVKIGGGGIDGSNWAESWGQEGARSQWIYSLLEFQGKVFASFAGEPASGEVWSWPNTAP